MGPRTSQIGDSRARSFTRRLCIAAAVAAFTATLLTTATAQAGFGLASFSATATERGGPVEFQAGSHPNEYTLRFSMNQDGGGEPEGTLRSLAVDLPAGLIANPRVVPRCSMADFDTGILPSCPGDSQIGVGRVEAFDLGSAAVAPIFNLVPPPGAAAAIGFGGESFSVIQRVSVAAVGGEGALHVSVPTMASLGIQSVEETIWGFPADSEHDPERTCIDPGDGSYVEGCASEADPNPLLTMPTSCGGPLETTLSVSSLEEMDRVVSRSALSLDDEGNPQGMVGCNALRFEPTIAARPGSGVADSPTGLHFGVHLPPVEGAEEPAAANLRDAIVRLPAGIGVNPSAGDGLLACSSGQIGLESAAGAVPVELTPGPAACPDAAKIGTARIVTPLLAEPLQGAIYLARQGDNPFGSLLALYIAVDDPLRGVVVKLAGRVALDPASGQVTVTFRESPQLPFEDLELDFFAGPRAIFTTPPTCGRYATTTVLTPWTAPEGADAAPSDSFQVISAPGGGACAASEAQAPNAPAFEAGTVAPTAGAASPFVLRLKRENGAQRLRALKVALPPGLTARVAGVAECAEAQLARAAGRGAAGAGALEQASPSCPATSEVGSAAIAVGSGTPFHLRGHVYLAGPYRGAPLSLAIVTPAVAGPLDLGAVVVRSALRVDPETAQLTIVTDPLPAILHGIPLAVRSVAVEMDRPGFIRNPTSCDPMAVRGEAISAADQAAGLLSRFQAGACRRLAFKPGLSLRLLGPAHRGAHPRLRMTLKTREGDAGVGRVGLTLPPTELLESAHIEAVCSRAEFSARACPRRSVYGYAKVWSPLLDEPLAGPVHLRESRRRLPDLVASLDGRIRLDLAGHIASSRGRLRVAFEGLPDVPLSKLVLTMQGGGKGLLVNTGGLCARERRAIAAFAGQNGRLHDIRPVVKTDCE